MAAILVGFQTVGLQDIRSHSKFVPFTNQPLFDHSKSEHVRISDPHCNCVTYTSTSDQPLTSGLILLNLLHPVAELVHVAQVEHGLGVVLLLRRDPEIKSQLL